MRRFRIWLILAVCVVAIYSMFYYKIFSGASDREKSVTVILKSLNVRLDFWQAVNKGAEAAAKEMGVELNIVGSLQEMTPTIRFVFSKLPSRASPMRLC